MSTKFNKILFIFIIFFISKIIYSDNNWQHYLKIGKIQYKEEMYEFALESLSKAIRLNPNAFEAYNLKGEIFLKYNHKGKALNSFKKSLAINFKQDLIHFKTGELERYYFYLDEALLHYLNAIKINSRNNLAYLGAANIYYIKGEKKKFKQYFKKSFLIKKLVSEPLLKKIDGYLDEGKIKLSIQKLKELIQINPAEIRAYFKLVTIYRKEKNFKQAIYYLEKLKNADPSNEKAYIHLANIYFTQKTMKNRRQELFTAIDYLNIACKINPVNHYNYELLSDIYYHIGEKGKAIIYADLSNIFTPNNSEKDQKSKLSDAIKYLEKKSRLFSKEYYIYILISNLYKHSGNINKARKAALKAQNLIKTKK